MAAREARFKGKTALVTGAAGFIGGTVCRELVGEGASVVGLDVSEDGAQHVLDAGADFAAADVTDPAALVKAFEGADLVVHAAAFVRDWGEMDDFVEVNVRGTVNVLDAARAAGAERVVHISSVVVYGYDDPSEQDEASFRRSYGIPYIDTKSASDRIACRAGAVVIRPGDVYGPRSVWVVKPFEMAKAGQMALPSGDGVMLPVYIDDLVEAVLAGLDRGQPGEAYTAWDDGRPVTFEEHFNRIARMAGGREARRMPKAAMEAVGSLMETAARMRGTPPMFSSRAATLVARRGTVSTAKIRRELGWEPRVPYDEGMLRTEQWLREEGLL